MKDEIADVWMSLQIAFKEVMFQLNITKTWEMSFDVRASRGIHQQVSISGAVLEL